MTDWEAIVHALAAVEDPTSENDYGDVACVLCGESTASAALVHKPTCPWRLARELIGMGG